MPTDTRRLPAPEESKPPYSYTTKESLNIVNEKWQRLNGRNPDDVRPIFLKPGVVSQAKGSAYIELDQTKVICAVYGPREVKRREEFSMKGQLACEFKFATFSCKQRRQHQQDSQEKDFSNMLKEALEPAVRLEKFPKARLDVFVTVLQNDGSALAAAITCASVALADAGVEMYDVVVGCALRQMAGGYLLDPTDSEEYKSQLGADSMNNGSVTVGFMPSLHQVAALTMKGELSHDLVMQAVKLCVDTCQKIYPVVEQCLVKSVKKKLQEQT